MENLWRNTVALFWERPVLWLPLVCANLAAFCLTRVQGLLTRQLVHWYVTRSSSLLPAFDHFLAIKITLITGPFVWGTYLLNICFYVTAFIITASLVRRLPSVFFEFRSRLGDILSFSLKLFALWIIAALLFTVISVGLDFRKTRLLAKSPFIFVLAALVSMCIAYLITPSAIFLVGTVKSRLISLESVRWGRRFSILAVAASLAIAFFVQFEERSLVTTAPISRGKLLIAIGAVTSLLAAIPYIPLFISLSLIADGEAPHHGTPHADV
jgi:hypothetical protein